MSVKENGLAGGREYREVITKAVCGREYKEFQFRRKVSIPENRVLTKLLGTSITKVSLPRERVLTADRARVYVPVKGGFEVNVWYSFNNNQSTDIVAEKVLFEEVIPVKLSAGIKGREVVAILDVDDGPCCTEAEVEGTSRINIVTGLKVSVEIIGETKILIRTVGNN